MCEYQVVVKNSYGEYKIKKNSYKEALDSYEVIKEKFANTLADITVWNVTRNIKCFEKKSNTKTFDELYNNLLSDLEALAEYSLEQKVLVDLYNKKTVDFSHMVEEMDVLNMTQEEQAMQLLNMKTMVTKRRLHKSEAKKCCVFYESLNKILDEVIKYNDIRESEERKSWGAIKNREYFKLLSGSIWQNLNKLMGRLNRHELKKVKEIKNEY